MPTHNFEFPLEKLEENKMKKRQERYVIGPNGEKRPAAPESNAVRVMEILTGIREEEYVELPKRKQKKRSK